jgi:hypothetical protein
LWMRCRLYCKKVVTENRNDAPVMLFSVPALSDAVPERMRQC